MATPGGLGMEMGNTTTTNAARVLSLAVPSRSLSFVLCPPALSIPAPHAATNTVRLSVGTRRCC